jgi:HEAT repeat protein
LATASDPAVKNQLKDLERALLLEAELLGRDVVSASDIGELAVRPKSIAVVQELKKALNATDPGTRVSALYGLSELPWDEFRPHLLEGLKDKSPLVNTEAIAFASEHQDDEEVVRLLNDLRTRPPRELLETSDWLDRLRKPRFCE